MRESEVKVYQLPNDNEVVRTSHQRRHSSHLSDKQERNQLSKTAEASDKTFQKIQFVAKSKHAFATVTDKFSNRPFSNEFF